MSNMFRNLFIYLIIGVNILPEPVDGTIDVPGFNAGVEFIFGLIGTSGSKIILDAIIWLLFCLSKKPIIITVSSTFIFENPALTSVAPEL